MWLWLTVKLLLTTVTIAGLECGAAATLESTLSGEEHLFFREDDDPSEVDRVLSERYGDDYYADMTGKQEAEAYAGLPWIKAIIVYIDLP